MLVLRPMASLQRAAEARLLSNELYRHSDLITAGHDHFVVDGKQIDITTEHLMETQVAKQHLRIGDDLRCVDLVALRIRVRDVDRRRERVSDDENVMHVLTEHVKVSDVVKKTMRVNQGCVSWEIQGEERNVDETDHKKMEFGDLPKETEPEPVITTPEDEDTPLEPEVAEDQDRVIFQEISTEEPPVSPDQLKVHQEVVPDVDVDPVEEVGPTDLMEDDRPNKWQPDVPVDQTDTLARLGLQRKWSRRNRAGHIMTGNGKRRLKRGRSLPFFNHCTVRDVTCAG